MGCMCPANSNQTVEFPSKQKHNQGKDSLVGAEDKSSHSAKQTPASQHAEQKRNRHPEEEESDHNQELLDDEVLTQAMSTEQECGPDGRHMSRHYGDRVSGNRDREGTFTSQGQGVGSSSNVMRSLGLEPST